MQSTNRNLIFRKMFALSVIILCAAFESFLAGFLTYFKSSIDYIDVLLSILVTLSLYCASVLALLTYNMAKIGYTEIPNTLLLKTYLRALLFRKPKF
jgi:hypothetical protein